MSIPRLVAMSRRLALWLSTRQEVGWCTYGSPLLHNPCTSPAEGQPPLAWAPSACCKPLHAPCDICTVPVANRSWTTERCKQYTSLGQAHPETPVRVREVWQRGVNQSLQAVARLFIASVPRRGRCRGKGQGGLQRIGKERGCCVSRAASTTVHASTAWAHQGTSPRGAPA